MEIWEQEIVAIVQSVMSDSSQPHVPQHINLACSSPSPRVCSNSCTLSWWCIQPFYPLSFFSLHVFNLASISAFFNESSHSVQFSSVIQSYPTLQLHGLQHTRHPCPSPTPRVSSNSCSLSQWYHPTMSCSVISFRSHLQSFPASGSVQMSQFFTSGDQSIGVPASISVLPMNIQGWFPLELAGLISLQSKGLSRVFSNHSSKASILQHSAFFMV